MSRLGTFALACALTLGAATGTLGCKKLLKGKLSSVDAGTTVKPTAKTRSPEEQADEQMLEKIESSISCLNTLSSPVHTTRKRYFSWVDARKGVTGNERRIYGLYDLPKGSAQKCTAGLDKARAMPPHDPKLEAAGDEFAKTVTDLDGLIDQVYSYYENKNYKDDKFAKGKAMHPQLVAAFLAFSKADTGLHATLDALTKPLAQRTLARIERDEGKKFRYHRKHVLLAARELVEAGAPIGDDDDIDYALYNASFSELDTALSELESYGDGHKKDLDAKTNPAWPLASSNYDQFMRAADIYRKKAREYWRCLRDAPARAKAPSGKIDPEKMPACPDGRPRDVMSKYNEFIRTSNDHQFP